MAAAALLVTSGCTPGSEAAAPTVWTPSAQARVDRAIETLIADCMERAGFRYPSAPDVTAAPPAPQERPFGVDDVDWARVHGFDSVAVGRSQVAAARVQATHPLTRYLATLTEASRTRFSVALDGPPDAPALSMDLPTGFTVTTSTRGCRATAESQVYGDRALWFRTSLVAQSLPYLAVSRTRSDPEFKAVQSDWAQCMAGRHYPVHTLDELLAATLPPPRGEGPPPPPQQTPAKEVRAAVASAACSRSTHFTATGTRLRDHYLAVLSAQHQASLDALAALRASALTRAGAARAHLDPPPGT